MILKHLLSNDKNQCPLCQLDLITEDNYIRCINNCECVLDENSHCECALEFNHYCQFKIYISKDGNFIDFFIGDYLINAEYKNDLEVIIDAYPEFTKRGGPTNRLKLKMQIDEFNEYINDFYKFKNKLDLFEFYL